MVVYSLWGCLLQSNSPPFQVCWTTGTYLLPFDQRIPKEGDKRERISYYQWVALILACQAVLFYMPRPLWRLFNRKSGIAVSTITDAALECQRKPDPESRDRTIRYMVKQMGRFLLELNRNHMMSTTCKSLWYSVYGNYLVLLYLLIKAVYIANVVGQLFMLNAFLDTNFNMYGFHVMKKMSRGEEWTSSETFPRVTLCDFKIRVLGNIQRYTVQCSLHMNLFNEIIFIFVWFWFVFVAAVTAGSLLMWIFTSFYVPHTRKYIKSRLVAMEKIQHMSKNRDDLNEFVELYLRRDGAFIIRMVARNASDLIAAELIAGLWEHYLDHKKGMLRLISKEQDATVLEEINS